MAGTKLRFKSGALLYFLLINYIYRKHFNYEAKYLGNCYIYKMRMIPKNWYI